MFKRIAVALSVLYGHNVRSEARHIAANHVLAGAGAKAVIGGTGTAWTSWLLSNQFFGLVGAIVAVAGLLINFHFKRKEVKLKRQRIEREMQLLDNEDRRKEEIHQATISSMMRDQEQPEGRWVDDP